MLATVMVLAIRIAGPLMILWFPFAGALISEYVLDVSDAFIWEAFGGLPTNYVAIDKRLDLLALAVMAITVFRWKDKIPKYIALSLFCLRALGHTIFELTGDQVWFFYFPNLFFFFFIFYLAAKRFGKEEWFSRPLPLGIIFLIILALKMPQEYFLHYNRVIDWEFVKDILGIT